MKNSTFIKKIYTENTGGGIIIDRIELHNGITLLVSDEFLSAVFTADEEDSALEGFHFPTILGTPQPANLVLYYLLNYAFIAGRRFANELNNYG